MLDDHTPVRNTSAEVSSTPDSGISDTQRDYERACSSPTVFAAYLDEDKQAVTRFAWVIYLNSEFGDEDAVNVLRLCWADPNCRLWLQNRQTDNFWPREQKQTFAELMAPELHWRQQGKEAFLGTPLSEVTPRKPNWLLPPYLRRGKLHTLEGKKGVGKSTLTLFLAKRLMDENATGKVVLFTPPAEGDAEEDIYPRALAAGYTTEDLKRLVVYPNPITFADTDLLRQIIREHDAVLIVFDTMQRYIPDRRASMNDAFAAQTQLNPLEEIAGETGCAVLLIRHVRKGQVADAMEAGLGSTGIAGAARTVMTAGKHPDSEQAKAGTCCLAIAAGNFQATGGALVYRLTATSIQTTDGAVQTTYVEVVGEDDDIQASDLTNAEPHRGEGEGSETLAEAVAFLRAFLKEKSQPKSEVLKVGNNEGHSRSTLYRARKILGIESTQQNGGRYQAEWMLPTLGTVGTVEDRNPETRTDKYRSNRSNRSNIGDRSNHGTPQSTQPVSGNREAKMPTSETCTHDRKRLVENGDLKSFECPDCDYRDVCYHPNTTTTPEGATECLDCGQFRAPGTHTRWRNPPTENWRQVPGGDKAEYSLWTMFEQSAELDGIEPGSAEYIRRRDEFRRMVLDQGIAMPGVVVKPILAIGDYLGGD